MRFSYRMVPEVYQMFWAAMARGEFITDAALEAGTYRKQGRRLAGRGGRGPASARPGPEGSVFDVGAAGGDRARPGPR